MTATVIIKSAPNLRDMGDHMTQTGGRIRSGLGIGLDGQQALRELFIEFE